MLLFVETLALFFYVVFFYSRLYINKYCNLCPFFE